MAVLAALAFSATDSPQMQHFNVLSSFIVLAPDQLIEYT
jgi:hypothetical protein